MSNEAAIEDRAIRRALVIHHDTEVRFQLEKGLAKSRWGIFHAEGRIDGLRLMYGIQPDLIFLEVGADLDDSWETFARIRLFTDRPVILLAAHLPPPAFRSQCDYNALVLLQPISVEKAIAVAHVLYDDGLALEGSMESLP